MATVRTLSNSCARSGPVGEISACASQGRRGASCAPAGLALPAVDGLFLPISSTGARDRKCMRARPAVCTSEPARNDIPARAAGSGRLSHGRSGVRNSCGWPAPWRRPLAASSHAMGQGVAFDISTREGARQRQGSAAGQGHAGACMLTTCSLKEKIPQSPIQE
jgi:hypothetical protein